MTVEQQANDFLTLFKRHLNGNSKAQIRSVVCRSVDWDSKTMTAADEDGLPYYHVALGLGGMMMKPSPGSDCIIAILDNEDSVAWLINADEAEEIVFRDGDNGGLINLKELNSNLESLKDYCEALKTAVSTGLKAVGIGSAANGTAGATAFDAAMTGQTILFENMEDKHILH